MITFNLANVRGNTLNFANRKAAARQTQAQRDAVFAKYQSLVGTLYRDSYGARIAAIDELSDPRRTPEYWDEDTEPRLPLNLSSSVISSIRPTMGGAFITFHSNPGKMYFYPGSGTEDTAKRVETLVTSPDIGKAFFARRGI